MHILLITFNFKSPAPKHITQQPLVILFAVITSLPGYDAGGGGYDRPNYYYFNSVYPTCHFCSLQEPCRLRIFIGRISLIILEIVPDDGALPCLVQ